MRQFLRTILRILDGSPSVHMATRNRQRGQSLLELAFITPLLAILVAGAVEVGWYTNRWLSILEVTRVGARSATFLTNDLSPEQWNNLASVHPDIQLELGVTPDEDSYRRAQNSRNCETNSNFGFYSFIVCIVDASLDPLTLNLNETDDVVVSVFAIQNVNNAREFAVEDNAEGTGDRPVYRDFQIPPVQIDPVSATYKITYDLDGAEGSAPYAEYRDYPPGLQNIVVGRYPANANECTHKGTDFSDMQFLETSDPGFETDPFDYLSSDNSDATGIPTSRDWGGVTYWMELRDAEDSSLGDITPELQRGFIYLGQHQVSDPNVFCFGSEFSIRDVEELLNTPGFIQPDLYDPPASPSTAYDDWVIDVYESQNERMFFEPQAITLVEVFWHHDMLLNFPMFRPIQDTFGEGEIVIALWSAFPLPSMAPNIIYQLQ